MRDALVGSVIFACCLLLYLQGPTPNGGDYEMTVLLGEHLLKNGNFRLDTYVRNPAALGLPLQDRKVLKAKLERLANARGELFRFPEKNPLIVFTLEAALSINADLPYQLERFSGHVYYGFPPGSSVLSVPCIAVLNGFGLHSIDPQGHWNQPGENRMQRLIASGVCALLAAAFYALARVWLSPLVSAAVALGGALGTPVWSTASWALWSQTWALLLTTVALLLLVRPTRFPRGRAVLLATVLSWTYFTRPTVALLVGCLSVYLWLRDRRNFGVYAMAGAAWVALFVFYSWHHYGIPLPTYYLPQRVAAQGFEWIRIAGNLFSPSRGLLVYVPVTGWIAASAVGSFRRLPDRGLMILVAVYCGLYLLAVLGGFEHWWGGHSYGARLTADLVPFLVVVSALSLASGLSSIASRKWRASWLTVGAALLVLGIAINAVGVFSSNARNWNVAPVNVDNDPERLWSWSDAQFLAPIVR